MSQPIRVLGGYSVDYVQTAEGGDYAGPIHGGDAVTTARLIKYLSKNTDVTLIAEIPTDEPGNDLINKLNQDDIHFFDELRPDRTSRVTYWDKVGDKKVRNEDKSKLLQTGDSRLHALPDLEAGTSTGITCLMSSGLTLDWQLGWSKLVWGVDLDCDDLIISSPNTRKIDDDAKRVLYQQNLEAQITNSHIVVFSKKDLAYAYPDQDTSDSVDNILECLQGGLLIITDGNNPTQIYSYEGIEQGYAISEILVDEKNQLQHAGLDKVGTGGAFVAGLAVFLSVESLCFDSMPSKQQLKAAVKAGHAAASQFIKAKNPEVFPNVVVRQDFQP